MAVNLKPIITEATNRRKFLIISKWNITVIDLLVIAIFLGIIFSGFFGLKSFGIIFSIIWSIMFSGITFLMLLFNKSHKKRNYLVFFNFLSFSSMTKKYKYNSKFDTKNLFPYQKIDKDFIKLDDKKYMAAIEIEGINFFSLDEYDQDKIIMQLKLLFESLPYNATFLKIERPQIQRDNLFFLSKKQQEIKKMYELNFLNEEQYKSRYFQLQEQINNFHNIESLEEKGFSRTKKKFYFFIYAKDSDQLKSLVNIVNSKISQSKLGYKNITPFETINLIKAIYDPFSVDEPKTVIDKYKDNLKDFFAVNELLLKSNRLEFNNQKTSITSIWDYPSSLNYGWLSNLIISDQTIVMKVGDINHGDFQKTLHATKKNIEEKYNSTKQKYELDRKGLDKKFQEFEELSDILGFGLDKLKRMNIYIIHHGLTMKDLRNSKKNMNMLLKENRMSGYDCIYKQFDAFSGILPKPNDPLNSFLGREVLCFTLASAFPFITNDLQDEEGQFVGFNINGDEIWFDSHNRNGQDRINDNMLVMAKAGAGKSFAVKKLGNYETMIGNKVILIDPEREYKGLAKYYDGNWIDLGKGTEGRINPLQILATLDDLESTNKTINTDMIRNHLQLFGAWFKLIFADISDIEIRYLQKMLSKLYLNWEHQNLNRPITSWKNDEFPTFTNLIHFLDKYSPSLTEAEIHNKLYNLLIDEFTQLGKFTNLYNGITTINLSKNLLTVLDIYSLVELGDKNLQAAQMYLAIAYIQNEIKINSTLHTNKLRIIIDECHLLIDKDFPIALNFIFQMVKRIRKRNGGITLITQNPEDLTGNEDIVKKTKAIINNTQYLLLLKMTHSNLELVQEMYAQKGGFTETEISAIEDANVGEGLFIVSDRHRHIIKIEAAQSEIDAFNGIKTFKNNEIE